MSDLVLRDRTGDVIPLDLHRWRCEADAVEQRLIASLPDTVIDIGCGPGRMVEALACSGRRALGIDSSGHAAREAGGRGVAVLQRSVFDALPAEGRWGAALLLDGNVGIGGDPVRLLRRVRDLLGPAGVVVLDVDPPGSPTTVRDVRLEVVAGAVTEPDPEPGPWFPWATVGADGVAGLLVEAGLVLDDLVAHGGGRWLARGVRP